MAARMTGTLYSYQTHLLYVGPLITSSRHRHHAGQVMWVPEGVVVEDADGRERRVSKYIVPPHESHSHGAAAVAAVLWIDRDDLKWDLALERFPTTLSVRLDKALTADDAREVARTLLEVVEPSGSHVRAARHPAVKRMCALLDATAAERDVSMPELARQSGLSMRQLRHCFTEELGINPSAYLRWRRLRRAVACIERGATLTEAALAGGFADGAHFSRVFQAQFGMSPSQALSSVHFAGPLA